MGHTENGAGTARKKPARTAAAAVFAALPALHFILMEYYFSDPLAGMYRLPFLISCAAFYLDELLLTAVCGSPRAACTVCGAGAMLMGMANRYLYIFRGSPFQATDLKSLGTAAYIASGYDFTPDARILAVTAVFIAVLAFPFLPTEAARVSKSMKASMGRAGTRLVCAVLCAAGLMGCARFAAWDYARRCDNTDPGYYSGGIKPIDAAGTRRAVGTFYDWAGTAASSMAKRPSGYAGWSGSDRYYAVVRDGAGLPDVVAVMDEAFSDPDSYGVTYSDPDYMPFLRSLAGGENSRLGELDVSIIGGNTANTEFEFLTGCSLACLPKGCIPYVHVLDNNCASLARYMSALGYETWALHPASGSNWSRDTAYARMGFDHEIFLDHAGSGISFPDAPDGELLSDAGCYEAVNDILALGGKPKFIFLVTIYNHGGYMRDVPGLERNIAIDWDRAGDGFTDTEKLCAETYLAMLAESDRALAEFTAGLSGRDRDALVLFFGDHQPDMTAKRVLSRMSGQDPDALDAESYKVPYGIWATFPLPEDFDPGRRCAAWAGGDIFECLGLDAPEFYGFINAMSGRVPSMTAAAVRDDGSAESAELEAEYRRMAYWRIFDWAP